MDQWHSGKIVLVWVGAVLATLFLYAVAVAVTEELPHPENELAWTLLILVVIASPLIAAGRITWLWLSARERRDE